MDLVITPSTGNVVALVTVGYLLTDHCLFQAPKPDRTKKQVSYRKYFEINSAKFISDFELSHLVSHTCNDSTLKELLNSHAPLITRSITVRPNTSLHSNDLSFATRKRRQAKAQRRRLTKLHIHLDIYTGQRETYKQQIV